MDLVKDPRFSLRAKTPTVKKLGERIEPFISDIEEVLESALEEAHRPIRNNPSMTITVARPRVGDVINMNSETLKVFQFEQKTKW